MSTDDFRSGFVTVQIPPVLAEMTGGQRHFSIEGRTLSSVIEGLAREAPTLAIHLYTETGSIRRHLVCLHEGTLIRPPDFAARTVKDGDMVVLTHALAGG